VEYRRRTPENGAEISIAEWIELIRLGEASLRRPDEAHLRRCQRVLSMVHELHKLGFQGLRIVPHMAASGAAWTCSITHRENTLPQKGAKQVRYDPETPTYSSAMAGEYFGWKDAQRDSARELAKKCLERFPDFVERGRGRDWEYVGWYCDMLGVAERGALPVAFADMWGAEDHRQMPTTRREVTVPWPPARGGDR